MGEKKKIFFLAGNDSKPIVTCFRTIFFFADPVKISKWPPYAVERFKALHLHKQHQEPLVAYFETKISKLIEQFLRKWLKSVKLAYFRLFGPINWAFERFKVLHTHRQHQ